MRKIKTFGMLVLCGAAGASHAQQAQSTAPADTDETQLADVVVTAERRSTTLQNVPIAVTVLSADALQSNGVTSVDQISLLTPGLKVDSNAGRGYVFLRGIGTDAVSIGADPSVGIYVDGVYQPRGNAALAGLWDTNQVEVLMGPQGTLYGRNTTGGAILITTVQPVLGETSGYGSVGYGNFNSRNVNGAVNLPIGSKGAIRLSGLYQQDDGYMHNLFNGNDLAGQTIHGERGNLLYQFTDEISLTLSEDYAQIGGSRSAVIKVDTTQPDAEFNKYPAVEATIPASPYDVLNDNEDAADMTSTGGSAVLNAKYDSVEAKSITAYRYEDVNRMLDFDGTQIDWDPTYRGEEASRQISQEFQVLNANPQRLEWLLGANFSHESLVQNYLVATGPGKPAPLPLPANATDKSAGLFGEAKLAVVSNVKVIVGGRYSYEKKTLFFNTENEQSWTKFTPKFGLEYTPTSALMLYATAASGFKSGGFNSTAVQPPFNPESLWDYELGTKSSWLDHKLTANFAFFYYDYKNLQVTQIAPALARPIILNAGSARPYGLDGSLTAQPTSQFRTSLNFELLHSRYGNLSLVNSTVAGSPTTSVTGNPLSRAPDESITASAEYTWSLGRSELRLYGEGKYTSREYFNAFESLATSQGPLLLANARLTWALKDLEVSLYSNNIGNRFYKETAQAYPTAVGTSYIPGEPRSYGVSLKYSF